MSINHENARRKLMADVIGLIQGRIIPKISEKFWRDEERLRAIQACPKLLDEVIMQALTESGVKAFPSTFELESFYPDRTFLVYPGDVKDLSGREEIVLSADFRSLPGFGVLRGHRIVLNIIRYIKDEFDPRDIRKTVWTKLGNLILQKVIPDEYNLYPEEFVWHVWKKGIRADGYWYIAFARDAENAYPMTAYWHSATEKWYFQHDLDIAQQETLQAAPNTLVLFPHAYA